LTYRCDGREELQVETGELTMKLEFAERLFDSTSSPA
jgi:hypothetical protein